MEICICATRSAHESLERFFLQQRVEAGCERAAALMEHFPRHIGFIAEPFECEFGKTSHRNDQWILFRAIDPEFPAFGFQLFGNGQQVPAF